MTLEMFVSVSLYISLCMFTVSNVLLMSTAIATVHCGGLRLLKPFVIWWKMLCKAVCVECLYLNPCSRKIIAMFPVMYGNSVFCSLLAMSDRSDMGW